MKHVNSEPILEAANHLFKSHPWHGVSVGERAPELVTAYIEMVPIDTVKYELDKATGLLKVDRPQLYSNICPTLYGLLPQTFCAEHVAELCNARTGRSDIAGDGDPLDICVFTEKNFTHGNVLLEAIPVGGLRMIDGDEADDKIIAVLKKDAAYGGWTDVSQCPPAMIDRLKHYFLTYKDDPESRKRVTEITHVYNREEAHEVIRRACLDYKVHYGDKEEGAN